MAADGGEVLYQVTCRRPTWPFEDWRYDVFALSSNHPSIPEEPEGVWYTEEECQTIAEVLRADSVSEDYPFRKQRLAAVVKKTLTNSKNTQKTPDKASKVKLKDTTRDVYTLDKVALGKKFFHVIVNMSVAEYPEKVFEQRDAILEMMNTSGKYLRQNCDLFTDCKVVPIGSMADGSKVYTSEEVDFLLTLPFLKESVNSVEICDSSDLLPVVHFQVNSEKREENLMKRLGADLEEALQKNLKTNWSLESTTLSPEGKTQIVELQLITDEKETVNVNLCVRFVIPVPREGLKDCKDESHPNKIVKVPLQNYTFRYLKERESELFAVISDEGLTSCAVSLDSDLTNIISDDIKGTGVAHTFTLAKIIIAFFFPQVYLDRAWRALLPSKVILNVVLYLSAYRKNSKMWTSTKLHERLIEVLLILERCAEDEAVNLFLLPGMVPLPVYTSNAYYYDPKRSRFLCSEEGYSSEPFECRVVDKDVLESLSSHTDLNTYFVPYFSTMRNNEWTFPDKLEELTDLLQDIFKCPVPRMWRDGRFSMVETDSGLQPPAEKRRVSVRKVQRKASAAKALRPVIHTSKPPKSVKVSGSSSSGKGSTSSKSSSPSKPLTPSKPKTTPPKTPPNASTKQVSTSSVKINSQRKVKPKSPNRRKKNCCPVQ